MPADLMFKALNVFHGAVLTITRGRLGWQARRMPVLKLTTTGRTSGLPRTVILTSPLQLGDTFVVVASRGGDDRHPDWYLNLLAGPDVRVALQDGPGRPVRARVATPEERDDLWPRVVAAQPHYAGYQERTSRVIPLILLEPPTP